jgi:hypothetical protein
MGTCTDLDHCRFKLGDLVAAQGMICGYNKAGGTIVFDEHREWHVTIVKGWYDEECGWRFWAELTPAHLTDAIAEGAAGCKARRGDPALPDRGSIGPEICFISEFEIKRVIKKGKK